MVSNSAQVFSLRPMGLDDIDHIAEWFIDIHDVALYERPLPFPVGPEAVRKRWETLLEPSDPPTALWFLAEDQDKNPSGICGLEQINYIHGDAIVPVFVGQKMRGKGLAIAMCCELIDLAFNNLRLHRLTTFYRDDHSATKAIVEKMGFKIEGQRREAWYSDGEYKDVIQVGLLKTEWVSKRAALHETNAVSINMRHVSA